MSSAVEMPKAPDDMELRNIIDKLAQFVARNGSEFENMTKQKQKDNPRFSFLHGGEFYQYYIYKVNTEQALMKKQKSLAEHSAALQAQTLQQHLLESEKNLRLQYEALMKQQQVEIDLAIFVAKNEQIRRSAADHKLCLEEFADVLESIRNSCSKDSIANNKNWFLNNGYSLETAEVLLQFLENRVVDPTAVYTFRLHILYLLNDLVHNFSRKQNLQMMALLGKYVSNIFCHVFVGCCSDESQKEKLNKLKSIWESQKYFNENILNQLNSPNQTYDENKRLENQQYQALVSEISQKIRTQYQTYENQHKQYAGHVQQQIATLTSQNRPTFAPSAPNFVSAQSSAGSYVPTPESAPMWTSSTASHPPPFTASRPPAVPLQPLMGIPIRGHLGGLGTTGVPPGPRSLGTPQPLFLPTSATAFQHQRPIQRPPCFEPIIPKVPYYDLPAGLMVPLIGLKDGGYKSMDPGQLRLPAPMPPSERLLAAIDTFYALPSHENPRDTDGWERLGLYEFFKAKQDALKKDKRDLFEGATDDDDDQDQDQDQKGRARLSSRRYSSDGSRGSNSPRDDLRSRSPS